MAFMIPCVVRYQGISCRCITTSRKFELGSIWEITRVRSTYMCWSMVWIPRAGRLLCDANAIARISLATINSSYQVSLIFGISCYIAQQSQFVSMENFSSMEMFWWRFRVTPSYPVYSQFLLLPHKRYHYCIIVGCWRHRWHIS